MKTLKFINSEKGQFTAALRKNVYDYFQENGISTKGNIEMVFKFIAMISLYFIPFILMLAFPMQDWLIFPLSIIMGVGMAGIGMGVMHDAVHGSFSNKKWLNSLLSNTMYFIGANTFNWRIQHNVMHHTYTNIEGFDEDIEPKASLRLSKQTPLKKIHRFQYIYAFFLYCFMTLARMTNDVVQLIKYNKAGITKKRGTSPTKEMFILVLTKVGYFAFIFGMPLLFSEFTWWSILLGFLIMHLVAGVFMSIVFQMAHLVEEVEQPLPNQEGVINKEWAIHELETTANFSRKSRFFSWLIGGLNYQIEHHLFPNICHIHYRAIAPIVQKTAKDFGVPYKENRTFFSAIGSHIRMLRALGQ